jgi:zinc transport system permease protein
MSGAVGFWESWFVWRDAMAVAIIGAAALSYLGVWVVLKRVVYVPLALSQVSAAGVVAAYLVATLAGIHPHCDTGCGIPVDPGWVALAFALGAAIPFAKSQKDSAEAVVVAYLVSGALVLILGGFVRQDLHDVQRVLFGNAVLVDTMQIAYVGAAAILTFAIHRLFYARFLYVSFDPDAAGAAGIRRFGTEVLLYATFALMISVVTRAIGALPAFGLMVLPALTGLRFARSMRAAFAIAIAAGVLSAGLGYYASFALGLPTGAAMVALSGIFYVGSLIKRSR